MAPSALEIAVVCVVFTSAIVRSTIGFGDGLVAMPILTLFAGLPVATPLVSLCGVATGTLILAASWSDVELAAAWRILIGAAIGIPFGVFALEHLPPIVLKRGLGSVLVAFALYSLSRSQPPELRSESWSFMFGLISGALGAAFNTAGPPLVLLGALRRWSPRRFRATMMSAFLPINIMVAFGHQQRGFWTLPVVHCFLWALPLLVLAVCIGSRLNRHLPEGDRFQRSLFSIIAGLGTLMFL